jgi:WD40 repeat protein
MDMTIKIWNIFTGECITTFTGHTADVLALLLLKHGQLASASDDHQIKIWNLDTGQCLHTFTGHTAEVNSLAQLANSWLVSASGDGSLRIWDVEEGICVRVIGPEHGWPRWVLAMDMLSDGRLVLASADGKIFIWSIDLEALPKLVEIDNISPSHVLSSTKTISSPAEILSIELALSLSDNVAFSLECPAIGTVDFSTADLHHVCDNATSLTGDAREENTETRRLRHLQLVSLRAF